MPPWSSRTTDAGGWRTTGDTAATPRMPCAEQICDSSFSGRTSKVCWHASTAATRHDSFRHEMRHEFSTPNGRNTESRPPLTSWEDASGLAICDALPPSMPTCVRYSKCSAWPDRRQAVDARVSIQDPIAPDRRLRRRFGLAMADGSSPSDTSRGATAAQLVHQGERAVRRSPAAQGESDLPATTECLARARGHAVPYHDDARP